ncbi:MAG: DUF58 domain-containing protein [Gammaproteobacteria bacterium]|nr:DUF58 domain-containing protein [Gammaproteobacteria bacterium]
MLFLLLVASINYSLSLGYLLTFLLAGMGGMSMLHTFRNLARLSISPGKIEPVFAGETAQFHLVMHNPSATRFSVGIKHAKLQNASPSFGDVAGALGNTHTSTNLMLPMTMNTRGLVESGRIEIFTEYPVGLFHAWSYVDFGMTCLVYPKPDQGGGALPISAFGDGEGNMPVAGDEEFQSLRAYRQGDTPRQIAWKTLAREQGLLVKEFGSTTSADLWLDYMQLEGMGVEQRLSRLTWWVMEAERANLPYGLKLPNATFKPSFGRQHRDTCLRALALYGLVD